MKLSIRNLGKIRKADIMLDGITVIAGANDSGKSTVGKALGAMFHSFREIDSYIPRQRYLEIARNTISALQQQPKFHGIDHSAGTPDLLPGMGDLFSIQAALLKQMPRDFDATMAQLSQIAKDTYQLDLKSDETIYHILESKVQDVIGLNDNELERHQADIVFGDIFAKQVNSLFNDEPAEVSLEVQKETIKVQFQKETCIQLLRRVNLHSDMTYLGNPFIIDEDLILRRRKSLLTKDLMNKLYTGRGQELAASLLNRKSMQAIMDKLETLVPGTLSMQGANLALQQKQMKEPLKVANISVGVKSFAIIKRLIENGWLQERDVMVFDEPEIHVHPEWQLIFAELLVLLQKEFDMTILLTTHSPYFLNALEVFSFKHGSKEKLKCYLSSNTDEGVTFRDVTGHSDFVYEKLAEPFNRLEELREALGMED